MGFSYATNGSTTSDDYIQSQNTYGFLLSFFAAYPEFAKNEFFITGESYAGIYVPTLAYRVYEGNAAGKPHINIAGAAIGNGCWGEAVGTCSGSPDSDRIALTFYRGHSMISESRWESILSACGEGFNASGGDCEGEKSAAFNSVGNIDVTATKQHTAPSIPLLLPASTHLLLPPPLLRCTMCTTSATTDCRRPLTASCVHRLAGPSGA